ncbi:glycosyltransferase family 2 protein [candidate division KSB1 bacterium]|nr:MAG: glycosyltransferase family 2 protein [candidate division KSB1 bacterium]
MPDTTRIAIIVLNWNGLADTRECLNSLFALEGEKPAIYMVDNGSTDGSAEVLQREFGDKIILIANEQNLLYAGGNNVGIQRALKDGCSHLLLLNNDTIADSLLLREFFRAEERSGDGIYCPKIYYADEPKKLWYAGGILKLKRARTAHRGIRETDNGQYDVMEETGWATGCALFAPRRVFETVGLLDESFQLYSEDLDYCLRARDAGFPIIYVPAAKVWHKVSASIGGNLSRRKLVRKWNSLRRLLRKHVPNPLTRLIALSDFTVTETIRVFFAFVSGRLK